MPPERDLRDKKVTGRVDSLRQICYNGSAATTPPQTPPQMPQVQTITAADVTTMSFEEFKARFGENARKRYGANADFFMRRDWKALQQKNDA